MRQQLTNFLRGILNILQNAVNLRFTLGRNGIDPNQNVADRLAIFAHCIVKRGCHLCEICQRLSHIILAFVRSDGFGQRMGNLLNILRDVREILHESVSRHTLDDSWNSVAVLQLRATVCARGNRQVIFPEQARAILGYGRVDEKRNTRLNTDVDSRLAFVEANALNRTDGDPRDSHLREFGDTYCVIEKRIDNVTFASTWPLYDETINSQSSQPSGYDKDGNFGGRSKAAHICRRCERTSVLADGRTSTILITSGTDRHR